MKSTNQLLGIPHDIGNRLGAVWHHLLHLPGSKTLQRSSLHRGRGRMTGTGRKRSKIMGSGFFSMYFMVNFSGNYYDAL